MWLGRPFSYTQDLLSTDFVLRVNAFLGYFDLIDMLFCNKNQYYLGWGKWHIGRNKNTARLGRPFPYTQDQFSGDFVLKVKSIFLGYFDLMDMFFCNKNQYYLGRAKWHIGQNKNTARLGRPFPTHRICLAAILLSKLNQMFWDTLTLLTCWAVINIHNIWGELTDISAKNHEGSECPKIVECYFENKLTGINGSQAFFKSKSAFT